MSKPIFTKLPGYPFDSASFRIRPIDVSTMFVLNADFQRKVRRTKMVQNIQQTMLSVKQIDSRLILAEIDKRLIVIDGKHRLMALATLDENVFVTMFADVYRNVSRAALPRIFEIHNASLPPSIDHLLNVHVRIGCCTAYTQITEDTDFSVTTVGQRPDIGMRFLDIMRILSNVYSDCPTVNRFTLGEVESQLNPMISRVFCRFADCFTEASHCPPGNSNFWWRYGWALPLMRVFAQNQGMGLGRHNWTERFRALFGTPAMLEYREKLSMVMFAEHLRKAFLRSMNLRRQPKLSFVPKPIAFDESIIDSWIQQSDGKSGRPLAIAQ